MIRIEKGRVFRLPVRIHPVRDKLRTPPLCHPPLLRKLPLCLWSLGCLCSLCPFFKTNGQSDLRDDERFIIRDDPFVPVSFHLFR